MPHEWFRVSVTQKEDGGTLVTVTTHYHQPLMYLLNMQTQLRHSLRSIASLRTFPLRRYLAILPATRSSYCVK